MPPFGSSQVPQGAVKEEQAKVERGGRPDVQLTLSSDLGSGAKSEAKVAPKHEVVEEGRRQHIGTLSSGGRPSLYVDTPLSQPKPEPKVEDGKKVPLLIDTQFSQPKPEPKQEAASVIMNPAGVKAEVPAKADARPTAVPEPAHLAEEHKQHPTGVWLAALAHTKRETVVVDGVELPRAKWRPCAEVIAVPAGSATPSGGSRANAKGPQRSTRRSFKLFRKADGQRAQPREAVVPVAPWAPAEGRPLAEVFCSQPLDSQSQLMPFI